MNLVAVVETQSFQGKIPGRFLGRANMVQHLNPSSSLIARHIHLKQALIFLLFPLKFPFRPKFPLWFPYSM